jgi:hypothetical protein
MHDIIEFAMSRAPPGALRDTVFRRNLTRRLAVGFGIIHTRRVSAREQFDIYHGRERIDGHASASTGVRDEAAT